MDFPNEDSYPGFLPFLSDINAEEFTEPPSGSEKEHRKLDFGWSPKQQFPGPNKDNDNKAPRYVINNKQYDGRDYDQRMILGAVEEWLLVNSTSTIAHPFHIHINPFQVVEIMDPAISDEPYRPDGNFIWQDVIAIPPSVLDSQGSVLKRGYVRIRHRFVDFTGSYVLHCHMLAHEDRGMMQLVGVFPDQVSADGAPVPHH